MAEVRALFASRLSSAALSILVIRVNVRLLLSDFNVFLPRHTPATASDYSSLCGRAPMLCGFKRFVSNACCRQFTNVSLRT